MKKNESQYRQLAYFAVIVAEAFITPSACVGIAYYLFRNQSYQVLFMLLFAGVGLLIAFYRIRLIKNKMEGGE